MRPGFKILMGMAAMALAGSAAVAQPAKHPLPDPTHIPFILPANIPWQGVDTPCKKTPCEWGDQTYNVFGDPTKPGMYGQIVKWGPGRFSTPHFHDKMRYIQVLSGTWWVSSSNKFDQSTLYPLPAGTVARDMPNTVHWDGAKAGGPAAIIYIVGEGPVSSPRVDETGKIVPTPPK